MTRPLGTIHLLVGKNNSGKSNVSRFVSDVLTKLPGFDVEASLAEVFPHPLDVNANWDVTEPIRFSVGLYLDKFLQSPGFADESFTLGKGFCRNLHFIAMGRESFGLVDPSNTPAFELDLHDLSEAATCIDTSVLNRAVKNVGGGVQERPGEALSTSSLI